MRIVVAVFICHFPVGKYQENYQCLLRLQSNIFARGTMRSKKAFQNPYDRKYKIQVIKEGRNQTSFVKLAAVEIRMNHTCAKDVFIEVDHEADFKSK